MRARRAGMLALLALLGCRGTEEPSAALAENAAAVFAACDADQIKRLSDRQRVRLAFSPCGSNRFLGATWSPDGRLLVFRLEDGIWVLDGVQKQLVRVPGDRPAALPAWLGDSLLAIPLDPLEGASGSRLAFADLRASTYDVVEVGLSGLRELQPDGEQLLAVGLDASGRKRAWRISRDGSFTDAFPWMAGAPSSLSVSAGLVGWADAEGAHVSEAASGALLVTVPGATRAAPHPGGRYVALALDGAPISAFDQQPWGEDIGPAQRARDAEREARWLERLPPSVERTVTPPEVQILDLERGQRWRVRAWAGAEPSWYPGNPEHLSFLLWGIEGMQVQRNVALAPVLDRVRAVDAGLADPGLERVSPPAEPPGPPTGSPTPAAPGSG